VVELGCGLAGVANGDEVDVAADEEAFVFVFVLVNTDSEDGQVWAVVVEFGQSRHFLNAGRAPGGPEVDQDDLAAVVGEMNGRGSIGDGEIWSRLIEQKRTRAAVAAGRKSQGQQQREGEEARATHTPIIRSEWPQMEG